MKSLRRRLKRVRPILGTYVQIELQGEAEEGLLNEYITEGFEAINQIDRLMSYHRSDSDLTRLNHAQPQAWITATSPQTIEVLKAANELFLISKGLFDIRCGMMLARWGALPAQAQDRRYRVAIPEDTPPLEIKGMRVRKSGPWILDLGGIAKGYAVDRAVKTIQRLGVGQRLSGLVNAGGDLRVWGNLDAPIAIRTCGGQKDWMWPLTVGRSATATSSVRRFRCRDSSRIVSTHVQMPSGNPLKGHKTVTVLAKACLLADALTKIVLLGETSVVENCLLFYKAKALIFSSDGQLEKAIG